MKLAAIGVTCLALSATACDEHGTSRSVTETTRAVVAASAAFDQAQLHKDKTAMDRFLAQDFRFVRGSGKLTDRADFIAGFTDPKLELKPFTITNRIVVPLGTTGAIVGGEGVIEGTNDGKPFREHFRYADTFQWRDGRWQVVYVQVTPIK
jgi:hypothetical protein